MNENCKGFFIGYSDLLVDFFIYLAYLSLNCRVRGEVFGLKRQKALKKSNSGRLAAAGWLEPEWTGSGCS